MSPEITQKINVVVEYFSKNFKGFNTVMNKNLGQFREITTSSGKLNERFKGMNNLGARVAHRVRMMTHGLRGFRMEMLGVMFFGMMINRVFMGLMQTSLEWVGVTEILSAALGLLFLPIALEILDWAIKFLDFVSRIPDDTKKWIGILVLLGAALGGLLFIFGSFALGIGSVILAFGGVAGISSIISGVATAFAAFGATILLVVGIVIALIIGMYTAWRDNFMNMKQTVANFIEGVKTLFSGIWSVIKGVFNVIMGLLTGDFSRFSEGIKQIFVGLGNILKGLAQTIVNAIIGIFTGALNVIRNIMNIMMKIGATIGNFISGKGFNAAGALQIPSFQGGGIVPGRLGNPVPIIAHAGERITPAGRSSGDTSSQIVISPIYNINVADKRELESMLRENNIKLVEDVRRLIKT